MSSIALIAVGYNRPDSMKNLLESIHKAEYNNEKVDLIVSIDKGNNQKDVVEVAEKFSWTFGEKKIVSYNERQGLRKHIIKCGDYTQEYDAVVVLEDDLIVSPYFFKYVKQTVEKYGTDNRIAGISLYRHYMHPGAYRPFEPVCNGYDVYMQQFAMSWGQCWTKSMWEGFKKWYIANENSSLKENKNMPEYIVNWNSHSWLKYYMTYIQDKNKYFVYPYISLSTNSSDVGQHCNIQNNDYQVSLLYGEKTYSFPKFENAIKYDIYFERIIDDTYRIPNYKGNIILDLYGKRKNFENADYVFSTNCLPYKKVKEIQLKYRPVEINCIEQNEGKGIGIYSINEPMKKREKKRDVIVARYDVRSLNWKSMIKLGIKEFKEIILLRFRGKK